MERDSNPRNLAIYTRSRRASSATRAPTHLRDFTKFIKISLEWRKMFDLTSPYKPAGDQSEAIARLTQSIKRGEKYQTLHGVTGSGKTFTMANIIANTGMPTLIMSHNKTLCAQLYSEFKAFFPKNHVHYFISHFDYYQPEAYIPRSDTFIDKDSAINQDLERLRLAATTSLLAYDDVIVIASVSANYGLGDPNEYLKMLLKIDVGAKISQKNVMEKLIDMGYTRNDTTFSRGNFRAHGEILDVFPAYNDVEFVRAEFFGDEIERLSIHENFTNDKIRDIKTHVFYAANNFIVGSNRLKMALKSIESELDERMKFFQDLGKNTELVRLKSRTEFDLEMIEATGICKGIENYARHLTRKQPGETPFCLMDYFETKNRPYLLIVDESHVSLPQFGGMYAGDKSRKEVLVEYGFRLPSALDNRPLRYDEFITKAPHFLFVSATPAERELQLSGENIAEQIIRPTGLLDPKYEVRDAETQVHDLFDEIQKVVSRGERVLVTTLTKKMAESLTTHYATLGVRVRYMHSDIDAMERNELIRDLRGGIFDVLVGINLLREGLDIPEVSLIAIMDADKEGFLRSETSLIQTMGRAARNVNGNVIFYAKKITSSMARAMEVTDYRRAKQQEYNKKHGITPKNVSRTIEGALRLEVDKKQLDAKNFQKMPKTERDAMIQDLAKKMQAASKNLDFEAAAAFRDKILQIKKM